MGKFSPNIIANSLLALQKFNPGGDAIIYGGRRTTWKELAPRAFCMAQALRKAGVNKGDTVTFMFHNVPEFIEVNLGIQIAGGIPSPMNYRLAPPEIEFQAGHCDAKVFLFDEEWNPAMEAAAPQLKSIQTFVCKGKTAVPTNALDYEDFLQGGAPMDPKVPTAMEEPAVMIYTGGTTGFPKGVLLSYGAHVDMLSALFANLAAHLVTMDLPKDKMAKIVDGLAMPGLGLALPITRLSAVQNLVKKPGTKKLIQKAIIRLMNKPEAARYRYKKSLGFMFPSMPLFHDASYAMLMLGFLMCNVRFILVPGVNFNPEAVLKAIDAEQPFFLANVPTGWKKIVKFKDLASYNTSSVKIAATGAGVCPVEVKKKMFAGFPGAVVVDLFGQTEMTPVTTFKVDNDASTLKDRSVGSSIVEVKIVDENGQEVPRGEPGEILYKSSTIMMGYYKDEEKTGEAMAGGWFKSGDLGFLDEDGEVRLLDRKKECINTGGEKVFPLEVEGVIGQHPAVENVCVIGVPDEDWGHKVSAVVQLHEGDEASEQEIIDFCRGKIAGYKIPKSVTFVKDFPLSPVGKILRSKVREQFSQAQ